MRAHQKRYLIESVPALGLYLVAMFASASIGKNIATTPVWERMAIALLPMPAIVWMLIALLRRLLRKDELEPRVELVAIAIASVTVGIASLAWGLLDFAHLIVPISLFYFLPALMFVYGAVKCVSWRRYG